MKLSAGENIGCSTTCCTICVFSAVVDFLGARRETPLYSQRETTPLQSRQIQELRIPKTAAFKSARQGDVRTPAGPSRSTVYSRPARPVTQITPIDPDCCWPNPYHFPFAFSPSQVADGLIS